MRSPSYRWTQDEAGWYSLYRDGLLIDTQNHKPTPDERRAIVAEHQAGKWQTTPQGDAHD